MFRFIITASLSFFTLVWHLWVANWSARWSNRIAISSGGT